MSISNFVQFHLKGTPKYTGVLRPENYIFKKTLQPYLAPLLFSFFNKTYGIQYKKHIRLFLAFLTFIIFEKK